MSKMAEVASNEVNALDFQVSKGYLAAPLGGVNEFSVDMSAVDNPPIASDGHPIIFIWGDPRRIVDYKAQGCLPVPAKWLHSRPPGGKLPIAPRSQSIIESPDGLIYKEGKMLLLIMTSWTNNQRLVNNRNEAIRRLNGTKLADQASDDAAQLGRMGIRTWEEERVVSKDEPDYEPARRDVTNAARIPMSGPVAP